MLPEYLPEITGQRRTTAPLPPWWRQRETLLFLSYDGDWLPLNLPHYPSVVYYRYIHLFMRKVWAWEDEWECWLWLGARDRKLRPQMRVCVGRGQYRLVNPARWIVSMLERPLYPHERVVHTCGIPLCVKPEHLEIDSLRERLKKPRRRRRAE